MRQYKFRCWDVESERWVEQVDVMQELAEQSLWNPERSQWYIITQFTGLTDKNGKEIYEGDVLETMESPYDNIYRTYKIQVIFWNGTFSVKGAREDIDDSDYLWDICKASEVIGNLYETPDLLTPQPNP